MLDETCAPEHTSQQVGPHTSRVQFARSMYGQDTSRISLVLKTAMLLSLSLMAVTRFSGTVSRFSGSSITS